jgi:hypothetical protein
MPKPLHELIEQCKKSSDQNVIALAVICEILNRDLQSLRYEMTKGFRVREPDLR